MYQPPNNQPDPNQSFYNDQTAQFSQQQPLPPPSYPQPGQYPPLQYPVQQQRPLLPHQRSWRWYKRQRNPMKWSVGCLALFIAFMACGTCIGTVNAIQNTTAKNQPTAPTHAAAQIAAPTHAAQIIAKPTPTPTPRPTATATPKPTAAPTAPPVVVAPPTHAPVPTAPPAPTQPPAPPACSGVIDDGVCYSTDPAGGVMAGTVPADFCTLVRCVSDWNTKQNGSIVQCGNGIYSHSGGVKGACSRDGGVAGSLYRH